MTKMNYLLVLWISFLSCNTAPKQFSEEALNDTFMTMEGETLLFKDILEANKGKTIVIDVWASWCSDCIKGMPKVKKLQKQNPNVVYIFLSLDKTPEAWARGIEKYNVEGEHYFMQSGWKGPFGNFIKLDWIPRYMVINPDSSIKLFKAIEADDNTILKALN